jgi:diketogulonate reductase-like aldo/keto reductase
LTLLCFSEDLVGQALVELQTKHNIPRKDLFIQTKFTGIQGQDQSKPLPYDPRAPLSEQVQQSLSTSLKNLHTNYIDSLVLHSPLKSHELTMEVYREFEKFVDDGRVKQLGISNLYNLNGLKKLYDDARHKPSVIQNRFHAETNFDSDIRQFCREKNIFYQSFWTLTGKEKNFNLFHFYILYLANPQILSNPLVKQLAQDRHGTPAQVFFRFLIDIGLTPLTGTTDEKHMKEDLQALQWPSLDNESIAKLKKLIQD